MYQPVHSKAQNVYELITRIYKNGLEASRKIIFLNAALYSLSIHASFSWMHQISPRAS